MNAQQLLQHFERISEAPDAIPRLRCVILDLAVRGKLVEQDPSDEPAGLLLERLKLDKQLAFLAEGIRARQAVAKVNREEMWFDFPPSWEYALFDDVFVIVSGVTKGQRVSATEATEIPYLRVANVQRGYLDLAVIKTITVKQSDATRYSLRSGDILMTEGGDWDKLGRAAIWSEQIQPCIHQNHIFRVRPPSRDILPEWVTTYVNSRLGRSFFEEASKQTTNLASINMTELRGFPIPLPPLAEQHRIVAKVDELMGLCDQLEAAKAEREQCRDSLVAASLQGLNQPAEEEETFREHARFTFNNLPQITTRAAHIKQLRQTILNLAVRGKLVEQDPSDEPASELLKRIAAEKACSRKAASVKALSRSSERDGLDAQMVIPAGWALARLDDIVNVGTGLTPSKSQTSYYEGGSTPWINSSATSEDIIREARFFVTKLAIQECRLKIYPAGSLIVALYGQGKTRGQVAELGLDATVNQACAVVQWLPSFHELKGYIRLTLWQQYDAMRKMAEGGPQPNLNVGKIKDRLFPLPPLAEQHRIVAKVDELMAICDQLETQVMVMEQDNRRFLESVLADVLSPGIDLGAEAQVA